MPKLEETYSLFTSWVEQRPVSEGRISLRKTCKYFFSPAEKAVLASINNLRPFIQLECESTDSTTRGRRTATIWCSLEHAAPFPVEEVLCAVYRRRSINLIRVNEFHGIFSTALVHNRHARLVSYVRVASEGHLWIRWFGSWLSRPWMRGAQICCPTLSPQSKLSVMKDDTSGLSTFREI